MLKNINCLRLSQPESLLLLNPFFRLLGCGLFSISADVSYTYPCVSQCVCVCVCVCVFVSECVFVCDGEPC